MNDLYYILTILVMFAAAYFYRRRKKREISKAETERQKIEVEEHRMFDFLHGLGEALSGESAANSSVLHRLIVQGVTMVADAHGGALYLLDRSERHLVPQYCSAACPPLIPVPAATLERAKKRPSTLESYLRMASVERDAGLLGRCLKDSIPLHIKNLRDEEGDFGEIHQGVSVMVAPLRYGDKVLGVLAVSNGSMGTDFTDNDFAVFRSVAEQSAFSLGTSMIHQEAAEKKKLELELQTAREVQNILLPVSAPNLKDYVIAGTNVPAKVVSGDYYDYLEIDDTHHGVLIADVSGKGVAASLIMAMCRSVVRAHARGNHSPAAVLSAANRMLFPDIRLDKFISLAYIILDSESDEVRLARAGHDPPLVYRSADQTVERLNPPGLAIGIDGGDVFERTTRDLVFTLKSGDAILLYTDGVNEALDAAGEEFGIDKMQNTFVYNAPGGAQAIIDGMTKALKEFTGTQPQNDDITLIAVEKR